MLLTLAFRHLWVRKLRSLFLLLGFALGVGVMVVLLSVGEAMVDQSRDVSLVGGGEITVLPQGIDVEAMRTGGLGGMFFAIDRARFLTRQVIGGPRHAAWFAPWRPPSRASCCTSVSRPRVPPHAGARRRRDPEPCRRARRRPERPAGCLAGFARRLCLCRAHPPAALRRARPVPPPPEAGQHLGRVALLQRHHRARRVVVHHVSPRGRGESAHGGGAAGAAACS